MKQSTLTFFIVQQYSAALESKVLGHELSHLVEQALEVPLGADFRCQLQRVDDGLFLLVHLFLSGNFFNLHRQVLANYFEHLFVGGVEPEGLVCLFVHLGLQLNHEENLVISEQDRLGHERKRFYAVSDFIKVLVYRICDRLCLRGSNLLTAIV
jgi:hypothetical protein